MIEETANRIVKIFTLYASEGGLAPSMHKELKVLNTKKINHINKNWNMKLTRESPEREIQMTDKCIFKITQHPYLSGQIKTTLRFHLIPNRRAKIVFILQWMLVWM